MGRIKNKNLYPLKVNIVDEDYILGSDSQNDGSTVNYAIDDLKQIFVGTPNTGESNTLINAGTGGVSIAANPTKIGVALQVNSVGTVSSKMSVFLDVPNKQINFDIVDGTEMQKGAVELATDGENAPLVVVQGNDARLSDSRAPTGAASNGLAGTYPGPTIVAAGAEGDLQLNVSGTLGFNSDINYDSGTDTLNVDTRLTTSDTRQTGTFATFDFESGSLADFTTSGDVIWFATNVISAGGAWSAQSGAISDLERSTLNLSATPTSALNFIKFQYKTSTEADFDFLNFYIDDILQDSFSGIQAFQLSKNYLVTAGAHVFKWEFIRDTGVGAGTNSVNIDDIVIQEIESSTDLNGLTIVNDAINFAEAVTFTDQIQGELKSSGKGIFNNAVIWTGALSVLTNMFLGDDQGSTVTGTAGTNSGLGYRAFPNLTTGKSNTGSGVNSGRELTIGDGNTFNGVEAGRGVETGSYNTINGIFSGSPFPSGMSNNVIHGDGQGNIAFRRDELNQHTIPLQTITTINSGGVKSITTKEYVDSVSGVTTFSDDVFRIQDNGDLSKEIAFQAVAITTSTTRTITMPDSDVDLTFLGQDVQTTANPTFDKMQITPLNTIAGSEVWFGVDIDGSALDPTGTGAEITGININLSGVDLSNDPVMHGIEITVPIRKDAIHILEGQVVINNTPSNAITTEFNAMDVRVDTASLDSTSVWSALAVTAVGDSSGQVGAVLARNQVSPIRQEVGTFVTPSQTEFAGRKTGGGVTWVDGIDGIAIFAVNDDEIYIGSTAQFSQIEVIMATGATKDLQPTFFYNTAADTWTEFFPDDETSGFQTSSLISWMPSSISALWTSDGDPGGGDSSTGFWIKIIRTRNGAVGTPTPTTLKNGTVVTFVWDKEGDLDVKSITAQQVTTLLPATHVPTGTTQTINWNDGMGQVIDLGSATGDVTLTLNNPVSNGHYLIKFIQGGTDRDIVLPASVLIPGGSAPNTLDITITDDAIDTLNLWYDGANYQARLDQDFG